MKRLNLRKKIISNIGIPVEEKTIAAGKIKTNYLIAGDKSDIVLLLHGNNASGAVSWYPVIECLSDFSKVIAPDIVGYGESDKPFASYDRAFFVSWLKNFLDALKIENVNIVGSSQGGSIALQFAIDHPERVNKLILAGSGSLGQGIPFGALLGFVWSNTLPSSFSDKWLNRYLVNDTKTINKTWANYLRKVQRTSRSKLSFWLGSGKAIKPIPEKQLCKINHQTLIVWGKEEKLFPLSNAESAHRIIPNSRLHIIKNAGHVTFFDQPEAFNDVVKQFLE